MQATGYVNGVITPLNEARIPVLDRGFLYGDSVYEVFRTYDGIPFLFEEHYQRLVNSARLMAMDIPFDEQYLIDEIKKAVAFAAPEKDEDIYVRYQITRGEGVIDLDPARAENPCLIIIVKPVPSWSPEFYQSGMTLAVPQTRRNAVNSLDPNIKGGNYLNNILGLSEAKALGADDCLMLDRSDNISECSNSNVWFVIDGEAITPVGENLTGLTRKTIVRLMQQNNIPVCERQLTLKDIDIASECFVTSATREVVPVVSLRVDENKTLKFPAGGGDLTHKAAQLYKQMVEQFVAQQKQNRWW